MGRVLCLAAALTAVLAIIPNPARADHPVPDSAASLRIRLNGQIFPAISLPEIHRDGAMSQDEFAREVARELASFTESTKTEACAKLCRTPSGAWGAAPITIGAHVVCPITNKCPEGMVPVVGIHSHPTGHDYAINAADKAVLEGPFYKLGAKEKRGNAERFSTEDFNAGPGYMVTDKGRLFYQNGPRAVRALGNVNE